MTSSLAHVGFSVWNALSPPSSPPPRLLSQTCCLYLVHSNLPSSLRLRSNAPFSVRPFWTSHLELISPSSDPCMFLTHLLEPFLLSALYFNDLQTFILTHQTFTEDSLYARHWGQRRTWKEGGKLRYINRQSPHSVIRSEVEEYRVLWEVTGGTLGLLV